MQRGIRLEGAVCYGAHIFNYYNLQILYTVMMIHCLLIAIESENQFQVGLKLYIWI